MSDQDNVSVKEYLGTSTVEFIPINDNVLIKAVALNSREGFVAGTQDDKEKFTYTVAGYGSKVTNLQIGDRVLAMTNALTRITIGSNDKSFERISSLLKSLKKSELEAFLLERTANGERKLEFVEYLILPSYAIYAVEPIDKSLNTLYNKENDYNVSSAQDNK